MMPRSMGAAYSPVMKTIHWTTVALVLALLVLGWSMSDLEATDPIRAGLYGGHKSLGLCLLLLTLFRCAWRSTHPVPALPPGLEPWEIRLVHLVHNLLYVLLVVQPLTGWLIHSAMPEGDRFFGAFPIPVLPGLTGLARQEAAMELLEGLHGTGAVLLVVVIILHVGAALKHHFMVRDDVLLRMSPKAFGPFLRRLRGER
jgi:cytochrome b561